MKLQQALDEHRRSFTGALFTTFVFNSDYFEGTLLPILRRKSVKGETVVCIDAGSYRETTSDEGLRPTRAGRDYYLSPMRVENGRFHPKVYFFGAEDRAVGFVGSANLTESAFDRNQEIVTRFDVQESDDQPPTPDLHALAGIRRFYDTLLSHPVAETMGTIAREKTQDVLDATEWLMDPDPLPEDSPRTAVLNNFTAPVLPQVRSRIANRDETIQQAHIIAPFYGESLAVPQTFTEEGIPTTVWLQQQGTQIDAEKLRSWHDDQSLADLVLYDSDRYVHGKVLLLKTEQASYCVAGSQNASRAALLNTVSSNGGYANIEVSTLRRIPEAEHFDYLLDTLVSQELEAGIDAFQSRSTSDYEPPEYDRSSGVELLSIDFTRSELFDGGRLHGRIQVESPVTEQDELQLHIEPATDNNSITLTLSATDLTADDEAANSHTFSRRIRNDQQLASISAPARVTPRWNGVAGPIRWLAIDSRGVDREAESAAENAGVDAVWRTVFDVYFGDQEIKVDRTEFLGQLATQLESSRRQADSPNGQGSEEGDDSLSGGITLPPYGGSTSTRDPSSQYAGYYETWTTHLHELRNALWSDDVDTSRVLTLAGDRLAAVNRTSTWLEITRRELESKGEDLDEFPKELPLNYTRTLYSESEPGFGSQNTSATAQFVDDATHLLNTDEDLSLFIEQVVANIIFGQLIAEKLIAGDRETFERYYGDDFENMISNGLSDIEPDDEMIEKLTTALWNHFGELPETLQSASLSRRPPSEFHDRKQVARYVRTLFL